MPCVGCSFSHRESQSYQVRKQMYKRRVSRRRGRLRKKYGWRKREVDTQRTKAMYESVRYMDMMETTLFARSKVERVLWIVLQWAQWWASISFSLLSCFKFILLSASHSFPALCIIWFTLKRNDIMSGNVYTYPCMHAYLQRATWFPMSILEIESSLLMWAMEPTVHFFFTSSPIKVLLSSLYDQK